MISKARLLHRTASLDELGRFALITMIVVVLLGAGGAGLAQDAPDLIASSPVLTTAYLRELVYVLASGVLVVSALGFAVLNYQRLQNTVRRCELAEDEMAWISQHPDYERMVDDGELMRLTANVRRVCRSYPATHPLLVKFLANYRVILNQYASTVEEKRSAVIKDMNEAAEEGLEEHEDSLLHEFCEELRRRSNERGKDSGGQ